MHPTSPTQARLPEIEELQKQLTATQAELTEAGFAAQEHAAAAAAREKALAGESWLGCSDRVAGSQVLRALSAMGSGISKCQLVQLPLSQMHFSCFVQLRQRHCRRALTS